MNISDIELRFCKYKFTRFDIVIPGMEEPFSLDDAHIGNWSIEKDYENYFFPYFEIRCSLPDAIYRKVMDASENVYVDLKIEFGYFDDLYEEEPIEMLRTYTTLLEDRFYAFIANKSPKLTDSMLGERNKDAENEPNEWNQYSYDNAKPLVMCIYKADHIFNTNQIINGVLSRCTAADATVWILNKIKANRVVMSPPDDNTMFNQMVIPPLIAPRAIMYAINTYGMYKNGATVFFDYDRIFVIDKKLGCRAWTPGEHKTVYLTSFPTTSDQLVMKSGYYSNSAEKYIVVNIVGNSISISNQSLFNDQVEGGNIVSINSNTGAITKINSAVSVSDRSLSKSGTPNRVIVQDTGSVNTLNSAKTEIEQSQTVLNIVVDGVNIQAFEPNKDFIFTTDNTKYSKYEGHYRMVNMSAIFTRESKFYSCMCTATFTGGSKNI